MNVYYRVYKLTPLKSRNRLSSTGPKAGVHLKVKKRFTDHFADYFPHTELGDKEIDLFLEKFKYQEGEYEQKVFHFLLNEEKLRTQKQKSFLNHQLWDGKEDITSPVVKYKIKDQKDFLFIKALEKNARVRLDANGLFDKETFNHFLNKIPKSLRPQIDYIEDPLGHKDWSGLNFPLAQDFIKGLPFDYIIHKPNARFLPATDKKIIMSSYMGSDLGRWHAYCELLHKGDLAEYHGILTPGLYEEQQYDLSPSSVNKMYDELSNSEWKLLCSI